MSNVLYSVFVLSNLAAAVPARALVWPDVAERVERDLGAADPATRRAAAHDAASLGAARGGPLVVTTLGDADDDVKLAAADSAIRLRAPGSTDAVIPWLNAPDARLRKKACEVARTLPSSRAVTALARTLGDQDPEVRASAAEALGRQASPDAVPPLLGRLDDPTPAVRIQIVAALARLGDARAVVPLVGKVQDSSPDVRQAVARSLGDLGDARASSALVLALRDQSAEVRREALSALGRMRANDAVDAIAPFAAERAPVLRAAALTALGHIATADAVRVLVDALGAAEDQAASLDRTPVRDALVAAGAAATPALHTVLAGSPSPAAATSAAWVLGETRARTEAPSIVAALRRGTLPTTAALRALAGAGGPDDVPVVLEFAEDPSAAVRGEALDAAMALLDPNRPDGRAVEPLAAALRDARPSPRERSRIALLLGRTGATRAAPVLVDLARAHDPALRLAAIDALGTLGPGQAAATDDALLDALASPEAVVRLHAAVALSLSGGAHARDELLARLDGGDEVDRSAALEALGGVLSRAADDRAVARLSAALEVAAGPERDAILQAVGRARIASAARVLAAAARSEDPSDRRAAAAALAAHPEAAAIARTLLSDADGSVRSEAAWSIGATGDASDVARLESIAHAHDIDAAVNAAAAIGRIAARTRAAEAAKRALCPLASDARAYVRANALAGLALASSSSSSSSARCDDDAERLALSGDTSEDARAAAALALWHSPAADDTRALDRCARTDPSGAVAARCRVRPLPPARAHETLVYVVPASSSLPRPSGPYAILFSDGTIRAGITDRRGAVFDPLAPEGDVTLRRPAALAR